MVGVFLALLGWIELSPAPYFAYLIGTTEPALRLLISILLGYPLGFVYNNYIKKEYLQYQNLFFIATGLDIAIYNFGWSLYHNFIPGIVIYLSTKLLGPTKYNVIFTFVFNMTYLLAGYVMTESEEYDITWTMPQCVLTLKLIALAFDLWDGQTVEEEPLKFDGYQQMPLKSSPTFEQLMGFIYFPACFLVGPIFSYRRYLDFVEDKFPVAREHEFIKTEALKRLVLGLGYLCAFQVGTYVFSMKYMLSDAFWDTSIIYRHVYCGLWAHFALYKYISCWLLTEASCIRFGLSYNGVMMTVSGAVSKWDGCSNIKLMRFECATKFQHYIDSFNCNTNNFAAKYVYKRLKFLGNRNLSQVFTLLFLALWHGTRSGYYVTFLNEFLIIYMEKDVEAILSKTEIYHTIWKSKAKYLLYVLLKAYTIVFMGWSLAPFDLKVYTKWIPLYSSLYYSGFLIFLPWGFAYKPLVVKLIKKYTQSQ
ncbi:lysophospholipid acyltransferase 5 [Maniola jurtina]|uniref:lysophospholipid acyltransferase 5 n=1 Tax=Maniola jurtina TaxID=191418 RepID=UPI001E68F48D|nr:lysophospholipid acyltransferase 5 [Maniola jurtina]